MPPRGNYFASRHFQDRRRNAIQQRAQELVPIGSNMIVESLTSTTAGRLGMSILSSPMMSFLTSPEVIEIVDEGVEAIRDFVSDFIESLNLSDVPNELNDTIQLLESELIEDFDGTVVELDLEETSAELQNSNRPQKRKFTDMQDPSEEPQATKIARSVIEFSDAVPPSRAIQVQCIAKDPTGLDG